MKRDEIFKLSGEKYNFKMIAFSFRSMRMLQIPCYYIQLSIDMTSKSREQCAGINKDFSNPIVRTLVGLKRHKHQKRQVFSHIYETNFSFCPFIASRWYFNAMTMLSTYFLLTFFSVLKHVSMA